MYGQPCQTHNNNFTFLHFLGILMVIYSHEMALLGKPVPFFLGLDLGGIGVKFIFLITGYLITQSLYRDFNLKHFFLRRFIRLYPALIACLVFTLLLGTIITTADLYLYADGAKRYFINNFLFAPEYCLPGVFTENFYPNSVNGSLWTMPLEAMSYAIIGVILVFLHFILKSFHRMKLFYSFFIMAFIAFALLETRFFSSASLNVWHTAWASPVTLNNITFMLIGSFFYVMDLEKYCNLQLASVIMLVGSCLVFPYTKLLHIICLPYFVMSLGLSSNPFFSKFMCSNHILYGMYLYAFPIQQYLVWLLLIQKRISLSANSMFIISLLVILPIAYASRYLVESPCENFLKKILLKKQLNHRIHEFL